MQLFQGWTLTKAHADLTALWNYITGAGALPPGRATTDLATYIQNNATYNVKDFGAVGDGVHDDYNAIMAAIGAAKAALGGTVRFPVGHYYHSQTIAIDISGGDLLPVVLEGAPFGGATLVAGPGVSPALSILDYGGDPSTAVSNRTRIAGLHFDGRLTTGATGIAVGKNAFVTAYTQLCDLEIYAFGRGIDIDNTVGMTLRDVVTTNCGTGCYIESTDGLQQTPTALTFTNCHFYYGTGRGIVVKSGYQMTFSDCVSESNAGEGIYIVPTGQNVIDVSFIRCWFENNCRTSGTYQCVVDGTQGSGTVCPKFRSCMWNSGIPGLHLTRAVNIVLDDPTFPAVPGYCRIESDCSGHITNWPQNNASISGTTLVNLALRVNYLEAGAIDTLQWDFSDPARPTLWPQFSQGLDLGKTAFRFGQLFGTQVHGWIDPAVWSASVTPDARFSTCRITATSNIAWGLQGPTHGTWGTRVLIVIKNASGGAMGATSFSGVYSTTGYVNPPNGSETSALFESDTITWFQRTPWLTIASPALDIAQQQPFLEK